MVMEGAFMEGKYLNMVSFKVRLYQLIYIFWASSGLAALGGVAASSTNDDD